MSRTGRYLGLFYGCLMALSSPEAEVNQGYERGILEARPVTPSQPAGLSPGKHPLKVQGRRPSGVIYVPTGYEKDRPVPLLLLLHGAGGTGDSMLPAFRSEADRTGTVLVAPDSEEGSWDVIQADYGPDVKAIDEALKAVFASLTVDPDHLAIGGFSDGASYALSLGVINGGLFTHVLAFAPGFLAPTRKEDSPRIFITHGTADQVLPIDSCSRKLVPRLRKAGFDLEYHEFEGGHEIPGPLVQEAFRWFLEAIPAKAP